MLTADSAGNLSGTLTIPAKIPAGTKAVQFEGQGGSRAEAQFVGLGTLVTDVLQKVTTTTTIRYNYDPLAQTFSVDETMQLAGVDLWFTAKNGPVTVQIRETGNGYPTRTVLGAGRIKPDSIVVSGGGHTRILFDSPVSVLAGTEYALVVLCDDAQTSVAVANLGEFDQLAQQFVTVQPYQVGVLLSSSNASTWTAHQARDLTFRLLRAAYTETSKAVDLGSVAVSGATDMLLMSLAEEPGAATRVDYRLTLPDEGGTVLNVAQGQPVRFETPLTGTVAVSALLSGSAALSPVLWPGAQLIHGAVGLAADYVTRAVPAVGGTKALVIYDAAVPSGASVTPTLRCDAGEYAAMTAGDSTAMDDGYREYNFEATISNADTVRVKLDLTGTSLARPQVRNLRVMVI